MFQNYPLYKNPIHLLMSSDMMGSCSIAVRWALMFLLINELEDGVNRGDQL